MATFEIKNIAVNNKQQTAKITTIKSVGEGVVSRIINENESYLYNIGFSGWDSYESSYVIYYDGSHFLKHNVAKEARAMVNFFEEAAE